MAGPSDTATMAFCSPPRYCAPALLDELGPHPWNRRLFDWLAESRDHRVICLVAGIWLLNAFDLLFTVMAHNQGLLHEQNPLARSLLAMGVPSLVLFKVGLVMLGSYPLLRFRRARVTEMGAIVILIAYALLAFHWRECYELYAITAERSVHLADISLLNSGS